MKWLVVCDPELVLEDYGDVLTGLPPEEDAVGCPADWRSAYLEATVDQVRPLREMTNRVCRLRPVWEAQSLSPGEILLLGRRIEQERAKHGSDGATDQSSTDHPGD